MGTAGSGAQLLHKDGVPNEVVSRSGIAGLQTIPTMSAYTVSKTALIRLSETLALEAAGYGIHVFTIQPGSVRTPMNDYVHDSPEVTRSAPLVQEWFRNLYAENRDTPIERSVQLVMRIIAGEADALAGGTCIMISVPTVLVRQNVD